MNLLLSWNEIALEAIRELGHLPESNPHRSRGGPPQVARSLGVIYTGIYEAWAAYDGTAKFAHNPASLRRPPAQRTEANRRKAVSQAAYRGLVDQFPPAAFEAPFQARYVGLMTDLLAAEGIAYGDTSHTLAQPVGLANVAVDAVLAFRHADGANQTGLYADTTGYAPVNPPMPVMIPARADVIAEPGRWQPLSYLNAADEMRTPGFIAPHWGQVKPFALASGSALRPGAPQSVLSQGFLDQARHVLDVQAKLTPTQKVIAEYWADGPRSELPPGHWTTFADFVVQRDGLDLSAAVKLYFALANAIMDASIATWDCKRFYDYVRPVTAIRHLFRGKRVQAWGGPGLGTQSILGESWRPFQADNFPTPPFAEFTSGHSAFSMAAAVVLRRFTGSDVFGASYTQPGPLRAEPSEQVGGIVMSWPTFTAAAQEAGESRLYGGIHFYEGHVVGLDLGRRCGDAAYARAQDLWSGA